MIVKLLTEHELKFLNLKGGCRGSSESTLVKMSNCWKSRAVAHFCYTLKVIWYERKIMKLDIAINYVCSWLFFDVSTLKHVLK